MRPASEAELAEAVRAAAARGRGVRAAGTGHSFTDAACTDGDDDRPRRRCSACSTPTRRPGCVTVEAGITLHRLGAGARRARARAAQPGRHRRADARRRDRDGDPRHRRRASRTSRRAIVALRLVTAAGDVLELSPERDPDAFLAARVGVGALGVVSAITLHCVPRFTLHRSRRAAAAGRDARPARRARRRQRPLRVLGLPLHADARSRARAAAATRRPTPTPAWRRRLQEDVIENRLLDADLPHRPRRPARGAAAQPARRRRDVARARWRTTPTTCSPPCGASASTRWSTASRASTRARRSSGRSTAIERRRLPITFPLEVRFAAGDDALLSTAHGARHVLHRGAPVPRAWSSRRASARRGDHGRLRRPPALGQAPLPDRRDAARRATRGGTRFQAVRARLDPDGVFANDYTRRVLG